MWAGLGRASLNVPCIPRPGVHARVDAVPIEVTKIKTMYVFVDIGIDVQVRTLGGAGGRGGEKDSLVAATEFRHSSVGSAAAAPPSTLSTR